jgi:hypothetical protein
MAIPIALRSAPSLAHSERRTERRRTDLRRPLGGTATEIWADRLSLSRDCLAVALTGRLTGRADHRSDRRP